MDKRPEPDCSEAAGKSVVRIGSAAQGSLRVFGECFFSEFFDLKWIRMRTVERAIVAANIKLWIDGSFVCLCYTDQKQAFVCISTGTHNIRLRYPHFAKSVFPFLRARVHLVSES